MGKAILTPIDNPEKVVKASNCMMSDGVTSVEDAINAKKAIKKERVTTTTTSLGQVRIDTLVPGIIVALVPSIGTDFYRTFIGFVETAQGEQIIAQFLGSNGAAIGATSVTFDLFYY